MYSIKFINTYFIKFCFYISRAISKTISSNRSSNH
nr:MAG TPA: hypothetical protein [Bacteriophage sp.]